MTQDQPEVVREAVAVFDTAEQMDDAINELMSNGFDRAEISLLASQHTVEEKLHHRYKRVRDVEDDPEVPRTVYVDDASVAEAESGVVGGLVYVGALAAAGAVFASGGTLAGALVAGSLAGAAGGLVGSVIADLIGDEHAEDIHEQLVGGGLLLWVNIRDKTHEPKAVEILCRHSGHDVHVHDLPMHGQRAWEEHVLKGATGS